MFRGMQKTEMSPKNFGVGSTVSGGNEKYLVVAVTDTHVRLLDLRTFQLKDGGANVADVNYMSEEEVRQLIRTSTQCTFTDYDYSAAGIKAIYK